MNRLTEQESFHKDLDKMSIHQLLSGINTEDLKVAEAVTLIIPKIEAFMEGLVLRAREGGRLFYIGAGTSGRLGILDASECPPTFGVSPDRVIGLIAGGDRAIRNAVEFAEDDLEGAWADLKKYDIKSQDTLVGLAASGTTPYVIGGLKTARANGVLTACITCNPESPITEACVHPLVVNVGPEFLTGSTRMKSGTAQKMVLNMISTTLMIQMGRVRGNRMVDMQLANDKLVDRGTRMIMEYTGLSYIKAKDGLQKYGSVRVAVDSWESQKWTP